GSLLLQQRVQHGQQEGRGLAAAGLAGDRQVVVALTVLARHGAADALLLHGGGLGEAQVRNGGQEFGGEAQGGKAVGRGDDSFRHEVSTRLCPGGRAVHRNGWRTSTIPTTTQAVGPCASS